MEAIMNTGSTLALSDVCVTFENERNVILTPSSIRDLHLFGFKILPRSNRSHASKITSAEYDSVPPQVVRISNDLVLTQ